MLEFLKRTNLLTMKKTFIKDIRDGDSISDVFLVKRKGKGTSRNGAPYLIIQLVDKSGEIEGRVWEDANQFEKVFENSDFIKASGKVTQYQGKLQLSISNISWVDEKEVDLSDFLRTSERDVDELLIELKKIINSISDKFLKKLIFSFLDDPKFVVDFKKTPAAKGVHHVFMGGLIEHVLSMAQLTEKVVSHYKNLNRDILLAGVFFHDIGKVRELSVKRIFDYTDEGKLIGHLVIGLEMVDEKISKIKDFPENLALILKHMILSHHGTLAFGSPKVPQILEALVLSYLDDLDAKINTVETMLSEAPENGWTEFNKFMDRSFFKVSKKIHETKEEASEPKKKKHASFGTGSV